MEEKFAYEDIIDRAYPFPGLERKISKSDRAAQFSSFAALTGLDDMMDETGRVTDEMTTLTDESVDMLNLKLRILEEMADARPTVEVTYFKPDKKKDGGSYISFSGTVKSIQKEEGTISFEGGVTFRLSEIRKLEGRIFPKFNV